MRKGGHREGVRVLRQYGHNKEIGDRKKKIFQGKRTRSKRLNFFNWRCRVPEFRAIGGKNRIP